MTIYDKYDRNKLELEILRLGKSIAINKARVEASKDSEDADIKLKVIDWGAEVTYDTARQTEANKALETLLEKVDNETTETTTNGSSSAANSHIPSYIVQQMTTYVRERVGIFDPNEVSVHTFISSLKRAYELYVTTDTRYGTHLENDFVRAATSRLNGTTLERLVSQGKSNFTSFDNMEKVLTKEYSHLSTAFQLLQSFYEIDRQENETISALATRLSGMMTHVADAIVAKFAARNTSTQSADEQKHTVMTASDVFDMLAGQRLLDFIRHRHPKVHSEMAARSLDNMFSITDVANEATRLIQLLKCTDQGSNYYGSTGGNNQKHGQPDTIEKKTTRPCKFRGKCFKLRLGKKCFGTHTDADRSKAKDLGPPPPRNSADQNNTEKKNQNLTTTTTAPDSSKPKTHSLVAMSSTHFQG